MTETNFKKALHKADFQVEFFKALYNTFTESNNFKNISNDKLPWDAEVSYKGKTHKLEFKTLTNDSIFLEPFTKLFSGDSKLPANQHIIDMYKKEFGSDILIKGIDGTTQGWSSKAVDHDDITYIFTQKPNDYNNYDFLDLASKCPEFLKFLVIPAPLMKIIVEFAYNNPDCFRGINLPSKSGYNDWTSAYVKIEIKTILSQFSAKLRKYNGGWHTFESINSDKTPFLDKL